MKLNIEFSDNKNDGCDRFKFSVSITDMPINRLKELFNLPKIIHEDYESYLKLYFGCSKDDSSIKGNINESK